MSGQIRLVVDNSPTPERIAKMGRERWQPAIVNQTARRPYNRSRPALECIIDKSNLHVDAVSALHALRHYMHGCKQYIGVVSSYGDQRWSGTTAGQENGSIITEAWPIYCSQKVHQAETAVADKDRWSVLVHVLYGDLMLTEAGFAMGSKTEAAARKRGSRLFHAAMPDLIRCYLRDWSKCA